MPDEEKRLKVVITFEKEKTVVGISQTDCDPVFSVLSVTEVEAVLAMIPDCIAAAKEKWQASPRYPKVELPAPPPVTTTPGKPAAATTTPKKPSTGTVAMF